MKRLIQGDVRSHPPRREVPFDKKANVELLVDIMNRTWDDGIPPQTEMARHTVSEVGFYCLKERSLFLENALSGRRLTDLGAGDPVSMAHFSLTYGASEYVAVDGYRDYTGNGLTGIKGIRLVNADMLSYIFGQPDESTNVVMNAIDACILRCPNAVITAGYYAYLAENIARVVPPGGIAFGMMSPVLEELAGFGMVRLHRTDAAHVSEVEALFVKLP